jgi:hypothetical protein
LRGKRGKRGILVSGCGTENEGKRRERRKRERGASCEVVV